MQEGSSELHSLLSGYAFAPFGINGQETLAMALEENDAYNSIERRWQKSHGEECKFPDQSRVFPLF